jgi:hypothetical protein
MFTCYCCISVVKDNGNWLLLSKNSPRMCSLAFQANRITILGPREEKCWTTLFRLRESISKSEKCLLYKLND